MVDVGIDMFSILGLNQSTFATVLAIFAIFILIFMGIGFLVFYFFNSKRYYITIELYKRVDNQNRMVKRLKAREHKVGNAGDILWFVSGVKRYIPPGNIQSGVNIYKYFERSDGEWINFQIGDIDEQMRSAGVRYIDNDMRSQRIAISKSLDKELENQSFWQKYGATITYVLEILIFGVAVVIIFYMFSEVVTKMDSVVGRVDTLMRDANSLFQNVTKSPVYRVPS